MVRLIVVDHSIRDHAGHYYEYAAHVLEAAARHGHEPVLVTNRAFRHEVPPGWQVLRVYRYGFWAHTAQRKGRRALLGPLAALRRQVLRLKARLYFSRASLLWHVRNDVVDYFSGQPIHERRGWRTVLAAALAVAANFVYSLLRFLHSILPVPGYFRGIASASWRLLRSIFVPFRMLLSPPPAIRLPLDEGRRARVFARDTRRLIRAIRPTADDVFFFPTTSDVELSGIVDALEAEPAARAARWHVLMRRNVAPPPTATYAHVTRSSLALHDTLRRACTSLPAETLAFHTDTVELKAQYDALAPRPFSVLPISHTRAVAERPRGRDDGITLVYLGDARTEKGYHLIPHLVHDLRARCDAFDRLRFVLQSNYNVPAGEPATIVGRAQLEAIGSPSVELIPRPLAPEEYWGLLARADLNLLLYDPEQYWARSSGILAESLAAGVPVIVPAGTWMSKQIVAENYRYLREALAETDPRRVVEVAPSRIGRRYGVDDRTLSRPVIPRSGSRCCVELAPPPSATHLALTIDLSLVPATMPARVTVRGGHGASTAHVVERSHDAAEAVLLFEVASGVGDLTVTLEPLRPSTTEFPIDISFRFHDLRGRPIAPGALGLTYGAESEIADGVLAILRHLDHFTASARRLAPAWRERHNADALLAILLGGHPPAPPASPTPEAAS